MQQVKNVKTLSHGPAIVAVSKFLHFWNPKLFVIVDHGVMWAWVFNHNWLWEPVKAMRDGLWKRVGLVEDSDIGGSCD